MGAPIEQSLSEMPGAFHKADALPWSSVYRTFADEFTSARAVKKSNPQVGITEHPESENLRYVVLINYGSKKADSGLEIKDGWELASVIHGEKPEGVGAFEIPGNSAVVLSVKAR